MRAASPASERESVDIGASAPLIPAADAVPARPPSDSSPGETLLAGVAAEVVAPPRPAAPSPERARREHDHPRPLAANRVFSPSRLGPTPRDPKLQSTRPDAPREVENDLEEPLLPASDVGYRSDEDLEAALSPGSPGAVSPRRSERISGSWRDESIVADDDGREFLASARPDDPALDARAPYTRRGELAAIWALGWPMGVSYFCRMAMASTDSVMVGHYAGGHDNPGEYLAAAALSDMITTLMVVPPLAFNQVLNALCGQAVGSGRPKMAGVWLQQSMFWLGITMLPFLAGFFSCRTSSRRWVSTRPYADSRVPTRDGTSSGPYLTGGTSACVSTSSPWANPAPRCGTRWCFSSSTPRSTGSSSSAVRFATSPLSETGEGSVSSARR